MKTTSALYTSFFATVLLAAGPASAAWFLKIEGVSGESMDAKHQGWIEVDSFSLGAETHQTLAAGRGGESARTAGAPLRVTIRSRKALTPLSEAKASGKTIPKITIEGTKAGGETYLRVTMNECLISNFSVSSAAAGSGGGLPTENITFNYGKIKWEYMEQKTPTPTMVKPGVAIAQLNPQPEPPGVADAQVSTVSPGVVKAGPPAITKVTPSASLALIGATVQFLVEGIGDCKRNRIEFGDGKVGNEYALVAGKGQPSPTHAYAKAGKYEVKAYGLADPWAKLPAPPPASQHPCTGHATTEVVVRQTIVAVPTDVKK